MSGETTVTLSDADPGADVVGQERNGHQVVHGAVEEALDLGSVQVYAHDAVGAGGLVQIGDEACRDRLAAAALLVLAGVGVERGHHSDALGGGPLERIDHDQLFHEPVVQRGRVGLDDEGVGASDALAGPHVDLAVGEVVGVQGQQFGAELLRDLLRQLRVRAPRGQHQLLLAVCRNFAHDC